MATGGSVCSSRFSTSSTSSLPEETVTTNESRVRVERQSSMDPRMKKPEDFRFISTLGEGSFSTVYFGTEVGTDREFAIKVCYKHHIKKEKKVEYVKREKDVMAMLATRYHPFFVRLYCTFQDASRLYFVMTLAKNGELLGYLRKLGSFDDEVTRFYSAELILALEHLHNIGVIHRDLKPENILLSENMHIMVSDFGSALIVGREDPVQLARPTPLAPVPVKKRSSFVGTAQYLSPEVLTGESASPSCDFWALGCIVYQMLAGLPPFRAPNEYLVFQKITGLDYTFPSGFPDDPKDFVTKLLVLKSKERLGSEECGGVAQMKAHPFFRGVDWESIPREHPPDLLPYLPASGDQPAFHSNYKAPESMSDIQPGLDDAELTRLLGLNLSETRPVETETRRPRHILDITPEDREKRLRQQKSDVYHQFVESNLILRNGLVDKRKGLFARRRMLLLTEGPHLYYVDPANMVLKGQIPWSATLRPEAKNFKTFFVHTPNRTYYLEDPSGHALNWCDAIDQVRQFYYCGDGKS